MTAANTNAAVDADAILERLRARGALLGYEAMVDAVGEPAAPIWYECITRHSLVEIVGKSGGGKSTLASVLTVALANPTGELVEVLGRPLTPGAPGTYVVTINEENSVPSMLAKLTAATEALGLPTRETLDRVLAFIRRGVVVGDDTWKEIERLGKERRIAALFVDSRARVLRGGDSNSEEDQARIAEACFRFIETSGAPMFIVSHRRKGEAGTDIEDISGSAQRGAAVDVAIFVEPTKNSDGAVESSTLTFSKIRDDVDEHPPSIAYRFKGDEDGRGVIEMLTPPTPRRRQAPPLSARIIETLGRHPPDGMTKTELRMALKTSGDTIEREVTRMCSEGSLTRYARRRSGRDVDVYRLPAE